MGRVLFVVSPDYPKMEEVQERLIKGSKTEHVTFRRKGDRTLKAMADVLGIEIAEYKTQWNSDGKLVDMGTPAYVEEVMTDMDFIIVYGTESSTVTKPYIEKATKLPYSLIFGNKVEVNVKKSKVTKSRKGRKS